MNCARSSKAHWMVRRRVERPDFWRSGVANAAKWSTQHGLAPDVRVQRLCAPELRVQRLFVDEWVPVVRKTHPAKRATPAQLAALTSAPTKYAISQAWSARVDNDPAHVWLRTTVRAVC